MPHDYTPAVRGDRSCLPPLTPLLGPLRALGVHGALGVLHSAGGDQGLNLTEGVPSPD